MNRAAVNRYAAIVLLMIAILSAIALKMSLNGQVPEPATQVTNGHHAVRDVTDWV